MLGGIYWVLFTSLLSPMDIGYLLTNNLCTASVFIYALVYMGFKQFHKIWAIFYIILYNWGLMKNFTLSAGLSNYLFLVHPILLLITFLSVLLLIWFQLFRFKVNLFFTYSFYQKLLLFLMVSLTLFLGGVWAQQEFNWGGWWSWDSVELTSLLWWVFILIHIHLKFRLSSVFKVISLNFNTYTLISFIFYFNRTAMFSSIHNFTNSYIFLYGYFIFLIYYYFFFKLKSFPKIFKKNFFFNFYLFILIIFFYCYITSFFFIHFKFLKSYLYLVMYVYGYNWVFFKTFIRYLYFLYSEFWVHNILVYITTYIFGWNLFKSVFLNVKKVKIISFTYDFFKKVFFTTFYINNILNKFSLILKKKFIFFKPKNFILFTNILWTNNLISDVVYSKWIYWWWF